MTRGVDGVERHGGAASEVRGAGRCARIVPEPRDAAPAACARARVSADARRGAPGAAANFAIVADHGEPACRTPFRSREVRRVLVTKLRHHGDVLLASPVFTDAEARGAARRDRRARLPRDRADARRPSGDRAAAHDRPRLEAARASLAQVARRMGAAARAARAPLRPPRPPDRAPARPHARAPAAAALRRSRASATSARRAVAARTSRISTGCRRARARHMVEPNLDALRRIGIYPDDGRPQAWCWCPAPRREARVDALLARARPRAARRSCRCIPGSRWLFKCWPAERTAALLDRIVADGLRASSSPARRTSASARSSTRCSRACGRATRARIVDLTGAAVAARARGADRARARVRRRRLGADAHRRGDGHAGASRCSARRASIAWGPWQVAHRVVASDRASLPAVRPRRLRRRQGVRMPDDAAGRRACIAAFDALLARDRRRRALMRLAIIRQRYTPYGGAERFVEGALEALLERNVAITLYTREWPQTRPAADRAARSSIRSTSARCGATGASRAPCAARSRAAKADLVQSHERLAVLRHLPRRRRRARGLARGAAARRRPRSRACASRCSPYHRYVLRDGAASCSRARGCRAVICNSQMVRDEIRARFGLPRRASCTSSTTPSTRARSSPALRAHRDARARASTGSRRDATRLPAGRLRLRAQGRRRRRSRRSPQLPAPAHLVVVGRDKHARRATRASRATLGVREPRAPSPARRPTRPVLRRRRRVRAADALRPAARTPRSKRWPAACRSSPARSRGAAELVARARRGLRVRRRATSTALAAHMRALLDAGTARARWAPTRGARCCR